jgi:hypothetical protein
MPTVLVFCIRPLAALNHIYRFLNAPRKIIEHLFLHGLSDFFSTLDYVVHSLIRISHICNLEVGSNYLILQVFLRIFYGL